MTLREVGERPSFEFEPRDHLDLGVGQRLDRDGEGGGGVRLAVRLPARRAGAGRAGAGPVRDRRSCAPRASMPVVPPVLVREGPLYGTGFFPGEREMIYEVPRDELFLVGTSEVSLAALHADEILAADDLPLRYAGISTCFRREAGAAGKDTRGIFRVHQFDKVEMFSFVAPGGLARPSTSGCSRSRSGSSRRSSFPTGWSTSPVGDLGAPAARKFDCEAWIPSQARYREVTSCSNTTDYQARRLDCRFRPEPDAPPVHVHTLNGTAVAVGRTLIALIENGQRADGSVALPPALCARRERPRRSAAG